MNNEIYNEELGLMVKKQLNCVCPLCGKVYKDVYDKDVSDLGICFKCYMDKELERYEQL